MANNCEESPAQSWQRHTWDGLVSSCLLRFNRIWFYRLCWIFLLHQKHHLRAERYIMWIKKCLLWEKCVRCFASGRYHPAFKAFISRCSLKLKVFLFWAWKKWSLNVNTPTQIQQKKNTKNYQMVLREVNFGQQWELESDVMSSYRNTVKITAAIPPRYWIMLLPEQMSQLSVSRSI